MWNRGFRWIGLWCVVVGGAGCAGHSGAPGPRGKAPLASEIRAGLGPIAIVDRGPQRQLDVDLPQNKEDSAAKRVGQAVSATLTVPLLMAFGGPQMFALGVAAAAAATPVVATVAATEGAFSGENAAKLNAAQPVMLKALAEVHFDEDLRQRLLFCIQTQTVFAVTRSVVSPLDPVHVQPSLKNLYRELKAQGVNTVIEVAAEGGFLADGSLKPKFFIRGHLWLSVVDVTQGRELYSCQGHYQSRARSFLRWAENDAEPFHQEVERCYQQLLKRMMGQVFQAPA